MCILQIISIFLLLYVDGSCFIFHIYILYYISYLVLLRRVSLQHELFFKEPTVSRLVNLFRELFLGQPMLDVKNSIMFLCNVG